MNKKAINFLATIIITLYFNQVQGQTHGAGAINTGGGVGLAGVDHTFIGNNAGSNNVNDPIYGKGKNNTFVGTQAGNANTYSTDNTFVGWHTGISNGPAADGEPKSANNSFFGSESGAANTYGGYNTFSGWRSGYSNTLGDANCFFGVRSGYYNLEGMGNTYVGFEAGYYNSDIGNTSTSHNAILGNSAGKGVLGSSIYTYNCLFGALAGYQITTGSYNVFMGSNSGFTNSSGADNIFIGASSGYSNTTAAGNVFLGTESGRYNTAAGNIFLGYQCGTNNTSGTGNFFMGYQSGINNSTANDNFFVGHKSGYNNSSGTKNSFMGNYAGYTNTSGTYNLFEGYGSGFSNTTGGYNTFVGYGSGYNVTNATYNTFIGTSAGYNTTGGSSPAAYSNTYVGQGAGFNNTTGNGNTALGRGAGGLYSTGASNTYIGYGADANANGYTNSTALGNGAVVTASNKIRLGNSIVTVVEGPVAYTVSDGRFKTNVQSNVKGLAFINLLHPVTYNMNTKAFDDFLHQNDPAPVDSTNSVYNDSIDFTAANAIVHSGFIAQDVYQAELASGYITDIVHTPDNAGDNYSIAYGVIVVPLVQAVQELSKTVDSLKAAIATLQNDSVTQRNGQTNINNNFPVQQVTLISSQAFLYQNTPNPAGEHTSITYYISESTTNAEMVFYDMYGKEISRITLENKGNATIDVNTKDLAAGVYSYSLVVNGLTIETMKFIRAK